MTDDGKHKISFSGWKRKVNFPGTTFSVGRHYRTAKPSKWSTDFKSRWTRIEGLREVCLLLKIAPLGKKACFQLLVVMVMNNIKLDRE